MGEFLDSKGELHNFLCEIPRDEYLTGYKYLDKQLGQCFNCLAAYFIWMDTVDGHDFWKNLENQYEDHLGE